FFFIQKAEILFWAGLFLAIVGPVFLGRRRQPMGRNAYTAYTGLSIFLLSLLSVGNYFIVNFGDNAVAIYGMCVGLAFFLTFLLNLITGIARSRDAYGTPWFFFLSFIPLVFFIFVFTDSEEENDYDDAILKIMTTNFGFAVGILGILLGAAVGFSSLRI
ncbi:MAG: hypothetical protein ACK41P_04785, partial [Asticcacaulis sp.]